MSALGVIFIVPGAPVGKGRPRAFRRGNGIAMHTPEKTANYEALVRMAASQAMSGRAPFDGAVSASIEIEITPPASWSQRKREQAIAGDIRPTTKPDIDNTMKSIFDAISGVVWGDDRQVVNVSASKRYAPTAGARVSVEEVCG